MSSKSSDYMDFIGNIQYNIIIPCMEELRMSFGEELYRLRIKANFKQEDIAQTLGVKKNTISNYENNISKPCYNLLVKLCNLLKVDANCFMRDDLEYISNGITSEENQILTSYQKLSKSDRRVVDFILGIGEYDVSKTIEKHSKVYLLPVYEQNVAAGPGQLGFDQKHTMEEFHEDDIPKKVSYGIHIKGSSMETNDENNIPDKSTVLVSTEFDYDGLIGEAVIANIGGVLVCKEYNIAKDGHLWLKSRNPNKSNDDRHIYDIDRVKIIGRVVKVISN